MASLTAEQIEQKKQLLKQLLLEAEGISKELVTSCTIWKNLNTFLPL